MHKILLDTVRDIAENKTLFYGIYLLMSKPSSLSLDPFAVPVENGQIRELRFNWRDYLVRGCCRLNSQPIDAGFFPSFLSFACSNKKNLLHSVGPRLRMIVHDAAPSKPIFLRAEYLKNGVTNHSRGLPLGRAPSPVFPSSGTKIL